MSSSDTVSMEFSGPVPGIVGAGDGYHVVVWVQAAGGAGFTRPSQEERDYYTELGKPVPEWQCEYFEFDGLTWSEAPLTVELWCGLVKLRSLCLSGRAGRKEGEVTSELPELEGFIEKHKLSLSALTPAFREALLQAAESAGVIRRGVAVFPRTTSMPRISVDEPWWRRTLRRVWRRLRPA